jgi:hypothetical protein
MLNFLSIISKNEAMRDLNKNSTTYEYVRSVQDNFDKDLVLLIVDSKSQEITLI